MQDGNVQTTNMDAEPNANQTSYFTAPRSSKAPIIISWVAFGIALIPAAMDLIIGSADFTFGSGLVAYSIIIPLLVAAGAFGVLAGLSLLRCRKEYKPSIIMLAAYALLTTLILTIGVNNPQLTTSINFFAIIPSAGGLIVGVIAGIMQSTVHAKIKGADKRIQSQIEATTQVQSAKPVFEPSSISLDDVEPIDPDQDQIDNLETDIKEKIEPKTEDIYPTPESLKNLPPKQNEEEKPNLIQNGYEENEKQAEETPQTDTPSEPKSEEVPAEEHPSEN